MIDSYPKWTQVYEYPGTSPTNSSSIPLKLDPGTYLFECWGASGTPRAQLAGKGAYVSGYISFFELTNLFLFIGGHQPNINSNEYTFNGGGMSQYNGGGSTDIRLVDGSWDDFESLKSRIIVAAGGGGPDSTDKAGSGGGLVGFDSQLGSGKGGKQTSGGQGYVAGSFGKGGGFTGGENRNGAGGSGYYGGGTSTSPTDNSGGGGSSFISGFSGCDAIDKSSTASNIIHTGNSLHYTGIVFSMPMMIDGNSLMPSPNESDVIGWIGHGAARISAYHLFNGCGSYRRNLILNPKALLLLVQAIFVIKFYNL